MNGRHFKTEDVLSVVMSRDEEVAAIQAETKQRRDERGREADREYLAGVYDQYAREDESVGLTERAAGWRAKAAALRNGGEHV